MRRVHGLDPGAVVAHEPDPLSIGRIARVRRNSRGSIVRLGVEVQSSTSAQAIGVVRGSRVRDGARGTSIRVAAV